MTLNPFDWTAGPFLSLYLALAVIVFLWGFRLRSMIGPPGQITHQMSALELAYLSGGPRRLGDTVLLSLLSGGGATIDPKRHKIAVTDLAPLATLMGRPVALTVQPDMTRLQFQIAVKPIVERVMERLRTFGYYPTDDQITSFRKTVLPIVGVLVVFGLTKIFIGAERHHPVGFLIFLVGATVVIGIALALVYPTRTRAGNEALQSYQAANARASRAPLDHELVLAVALSGAVVLSGTAFASVYAASRTMSSGDGGGGGGCGGGGGGGGGGCGGCS